MFILLFILCVVLYRRQQREGFFKKIKSGFNKAAEDARRRADQMAEDARRRASQMAEDARRRASQMAEEGRRRIMQLAQEARKRAEAEARKRAEAEARKRAEAEARKRAEEARRRAEAACNEEKNIFIASSAARATKQKQINDLTQISRDPNFNINAYNYLNDNLFLLKNALDENTEKNNDLKNALDATVGYQNTSVSLLSKLEKDRILLTECNINHSLSNQDYDVLT